MFLYFDLSYYFNMLRRIWHKKHWPGRNALLLRLILVVPLLYLVHSVFFFLDKILFPGLWFQKIEKPIFIVGHARSGTTLLSRLLAYDADRFSFFLYWEMFFPSLLEKKIIRGLGVIDRALLNSFFFKRIQAWDDKTFGPYRHIHNMGLWVPEEDDFVMNVTFFAAYWQLAAPVMDINDMFYLDRKPEKLRRRVMGTFKECVRRQLYLCGGDKIHLSKNPVYSGRVASIIEAFPDARILINIRDPLECVPSNMKLMEGNYLGKGWQSEDYAESLRILETMSYDCYRMPREVLSRKTRTPHMVVDYRDLVAEPLNTIESIYNKLELPLCEAYREQLQERDSKAREHKTTHSYSAEEYGIDTQRMLAELEDFYQEFQWPRPDQSSAA
ncbi:sulfotransferase family protein [Candidatus Litorirhabdus singularis]|nr:sulfotransferase [Candidatus Litorirhabdus singularis]